PFTPVRQGGPLVGPAVVERVARRVGAGVPAGLLAGRANRVDAWIGAGLEGDGAQGDPAVRCGTDALLEPLAAGLGGAAQGVVVAPVRPVEHTLDRTLEQREVLVVAERDGDALEPVRP